jgi:uncharacterized membrane protein
LTTLWPYLLDWANFLVRWLHLITGIAWIGGSFYFVWLDNHLREPDAELKARGVSGELWAIHGGGFYNPQKYLVAPARLPADLHWFKWEAYTTWLSGFAMLVIVYYAQSRAMMVGSGPLSPAGAVGLGLGSLVAGWLVYDLLCRSPLAARPLLLGTVFGAFMLAAAAILAARLDGRAAYLHVGAMLGTVMAANVLMVIIPGQRRMVEAMRAGRTPDPRDGQRAKQRSVHNNYLTLPVLFVMISHHYAMFTHHRLNWLVLGVVALAGVLIRHFFNLRHKGTTDWRWPAAGVTLLVAVAVAIGPAATVAPAAASAGANFAQVRRIVSARCVPCHAQAPSFAGFAAAPAGVILERAEQIAQQAQRIHQQAVVTRAMPIGNLTGITEDERQAIAAWYASGAPTDP